MPGVMVLKNNKKIKDLLEKSSAGFTLLEITVVVFIIALFSTIFLVHYRGGEKQFALQRSVHKLAQDLRWVQELTMRAKDFQGSVSQGGFGIYLVGATSSYTLFADCNANRLFDIGGAAPPASCVDSSLANPYPETLEKKELEKGVRIISVSPSPLTIVFIPPDPAVSISNDPLITSSTIILGINGLTKTITVNRAGLIAIEE